VCGPTGFMQSQYDALLSLGVSDERIFAETFGTSTINRLQVLVKPSHQPQLEAVESTLVFKKSGMEQSWARGEKTLLETAEDHGLTPEFSCRNGKCGACATSLLAGEVSYRTQPSATTHNNDVLICCAVPAAGSSLIELDL